jgi:hypothetical protein
MEDEEEQLWEDMLMGRLGCKSTHIESGCVKEGGGKRRRK